MLSNLLRDKSVTVQKIPELASDKEANGSELLFTSKDIIFLLTAEDICDSCLDDQ